jgi:hypothetical protein
MTVLLSNDDLGIKQGLWVAERRKRAARILNAYIDFEFQRLEFCHTISIQAQSQMLFYCIYFWPVNYKLNACFILISAVVNSSASIVATRRNFFISESGSAAILTRQKRFFSSGAVFKAKLIATRYRYREFPAVTRGDSETLL